MIPVLPPLEALLDRLYVVALPMRVRFRGITTREVALIEGPAGWRVSTDTDETGRHTAEFTTPTGMYYHCTAPPLPGPLEIDVSQVEARIGVALTHLHAA